MKRIFIVAFTVLLMLGCAKDGSEPDPPVTLQVSQTTDAHISQPITFTLSSVAVTASVNWAVTPNKATINANGNAALISFQQAGKYTVTGTSGSTVGSTSISVDTVNYLPVNGTTVAPFGTGEQLKITVKRVDSSATASGLAFMMETANSYSCKNSVLAFTQNNGTVPGTFSMNITGISVPMAGCTAGSSKAIGTGTTRIPLPAGTTTLTIVFNGTTYNGNIVKTGNSYAIQWAYASGVTMSPLSL
jgi:hypothetical protein